MTARLSMHEKKLRGTVRNDRLPKRTALDRLKTPPRPPKILSARAKLEWVPLAKACVELGTLTSADLRGLALLAECLASEQELREVLAREGLTIAGAGDNRKTHPAAKLLETTRSQAARLLSDYGLSPKGRLGVDVKPPVRGNRFSVNGAAVTDRYFDGPRPWDRNK